MESVLTYERHAIKMNTSLYVVLPSTWLRRYKITAGDVISIEVLSDGTLAIRPGEVVR